MEKFLEIAWASICERFDSLVQFINTSGDGIPEGDLTYARSLYSSWVLLTYASLEGAIDSLGTAVMRVLAEVARTPDHLPEMLKKHHLARTLLLAQELEGGTARGRKIPEEITAESLLREAFTEEWWANSVLMRLDKNAWSNNAKEWLERVGAKTEELSWMNDPWEAGGSERRSSLIDTLVRERNDLAHGETPDNLVSSDLMIARVEAVRDFLQFSKTSLQISLLSSFESLQRSALGRIDKGQDLGRSTFAFEELYSMAKVDEVLVLRTSTSTYVPARIKSIQCNGNDLQQVEAGAVRVAITINRDVEGCEILSTI